MKTFWEFINRFGFIILISVLFFGLLIAIAIF